MSREKRDGAEWLLPSKSCWAYMIYRNMMALHRSNKSSNHLHIKNSHRDGDNQEHRLQSVADNNDTNSSGAQVAMNGDVYIEWREQLAMRSAKLDLKMCGDDGNRIRRRNARTVLIGWHWNLTRRPLNGTDIAAAGATELKTEKVSPSDDNSEALLYGAYRVLAYECARIYQFELLSTNAP